MRVLIVSNLFVPRIVGGAEIAAHAWARWLVRRGHTVRVLTTAFPDRAASLGDEDDGFIVERRHFPYVYPLGLPAQPPFLQRAAWHWQDHFGRAAQAICEKAIAEFQPDIINAHDLQGIGYPVLQTIARSGVPCVQTLHDFGFLCLNMAMFRQGAACTGHCLACRLTAKVKCAGWTGIARMAFWSPSRALLDRYRAHLPPDSEAAAIPYPLDYAERTAEQRDGSGPVQLLYVGQVTKIKGVEFLLEVLSRLATRLPFHLRIVGGGAELARLREQYAGAGWVEFTGRVPPGRVGGYMESSDLLLAPSLWFENSPLVVYQAIHLGLPVLASRTGGLPELVADGVSGALADPGDAAEWTRRLETVLTDPAVLNRWRAGAAERRSIFSIDHVGEQVLALFERTAIPAALAAAST